LVSLALYETPKSWDFIRFQEIFLKISNYWFYLGGLHNAWKSGHFLKSMENVEDGKISDFRIPKSSYEIFVLLRSPWVHSRHLTCSVLVLRNGRTPDQYTHIVSYEVSSNQILKGIRDSIALWCKHIARNVTR